MFQWTVLSIFKDDSIDDSMPPQSNTITTTQSWPIVKIVINSNSNSSERPLSNSNTNSNSLEVSLAIAIPIAIVPKMVNSNSNSIAIVQFLLLKCALQGVFV